MPNKRPVVLCFSGHDPSGGAGIQADIETILSHQCHACSVITALTVQDTVNVTQVIAQQPENIVAQARAILEDIAVDAFKIGLIGNERTARAIHTIIKQNPSVPVILDPVLAAGGGKSLSDNKLIAAITELLIPYTTVLTPNSEEARLLCGRIDNLERCALTFTARGCNYVLITGTHERTPSVTNQLFHKNQLVETYTWNRLPDNYHGSGCTLAAAIAALIALGMEPAAAVSEAQRFTWHALQAADKPGKGQFIPNRAFWMQQTP